MKDFAGKIAFITGGASGAGFGQAQIFSEAGMKVVIADVRQDHLDEAMAYFKEKKADVHAIKLDVTDRAAYEKAAEEVERVYGSSPDLLVLTAGVNVFGPAEASTYEDYDWVFGVCFWGVVNGLVTFVPRMIKAGRGGHITATVSWGAFNAAAMVAPYTAAKAAALNLLESYYLALKPYGIGVSAVCPANIKSKIYESALNRPEGLQNTGYNVSEDTQKFLASIHQHGMEPRVLAEYMKKGIESGQFLVIPYPSGPRMVEIEMERFKLYATAEGTQELIDRASRPVTEEQLKMMSEREGYEIKPGPRQSLTDTSGFGKAKSDLDWIDPNKKHQ
ncbi:MAG: SDR family NAD(P)-dependent oxidoreductase [Oscillospiraceae bacterium]|nr:SDR family NAD(P)-dependent oxidoreductase [Oscillospiraceae bacterium]